VTRGAQIVELDVFFSHGSIADFPLDFNGIFGLDFSTGMNCIARNAAGIITSRSRQ
jgi:hypothetical protein